MAYKTSDAVIRHLKEQWEAACNGYLLELLNMWELNAADTWWVSNKVGETFCFGDCNAINMDDLRYIVHNGVTMETYFEWIDYSLDCGTFNLPMLNLKSFCEGAQRIPQSTFDHLKHLKQDLEDEIKKVKENPF